MAIKIEAASRLLANGYAEKFKALKVKFPHGKFPPKGDAVKLIKEISGFTDQYTDKPVTNNDWCNEDGEREKGGDFLFLSVDGEEVCIDYENQSIDTV
jgi:hypothetical protein